MPLYLLLAVALAAPGRGAGGSGVVWFVAPWGAPWLAQKWVLGGKLLSELGLWAR